MRIFFVIAFSLFILGVHAVQKTSVVPIYIKDFLWEDKEKFDEAVKNNPWKTLKILDKLRWRTHGPLDLSIQPTLVQLKKMIHDLQIIKPSDYLHVLEFCPVRFKGIYLLASPLCVLALLRANLIHDSQFLSAARTKLEIMQMIELYNKEVMHEKNAIESVVSEVVIPDICTIIMNYVMDNCPVCLD